MGFNFGAFLGSMGQTIAERVKDQEKYVNLLTDKALDVGTQVYLDKKKEVDSNAKEIEKHMATLAMTGLDGVTRFQIAQGGSTAVTNALNQYNKLLEKNKTADFNTFYSVKNSEEFKDMSDSEIISLFVPKATYDPSIARQVLKGRKVEGLGGLFVADPAELLAEYETKAGLTTEVGETRVAPALSVNYEAMQAVLGKEEKISFDTQAEAKLHYQQKIFDEQEKGDDANPILIAGYEGKIEAIDKLFTKDNEPKDFDRDKHLQSLGKNIFSLQTQISDTVSTPERVRLESELAKLTSERDFFRKEKEEEAQLTRAPKDSPEISLQTAIERVQMDLVDAVLAPTQNPEKIEVLQKREKALLQRKAAQTPDKPLFTPTSAQNYVESRKGSILGTLDFVQVGTMGEALKAKFGDGTENYHKFFGQMEGLLTGLKESNKEFNNDPYLQIEIGGVESELSSYIKQYSAKFSQYASPSNKAAVFKTVGKEQVFDRYVTPTDFDVLKQEAAEGKYKIGDIVHARIPLSGGQYGDYILVWTGKDWRN